MVVLAADHVGQENGPSLHPALGVDDHRARFVGYPIGG